MSYYMLDNPNPNAQQYREGRRGRFTGGVLLHTTESPKERGAGPIAHWIATQRSDYGSYHVIVDDKRAIVMAPDNFEVWHCAARGYNQATWGISFACRSVDLNPDDQWTRDAINQAGYQIAAMWTRNGIEFAGPKPAAELLESSGFATHGDAQPWDRSDAWTRHPRRTELENLLVEAINNNRLPQPPTEGETPVKQVMMRNQKTGTISVFYQGTPFRLDLRPQDVDKFRFFGIEDKGNSDPWFWEVSQPVKPVYK
jgi:hypothetical protein